MSIDTRKPYFAEDSMYSRLWSERAIYTAVPRVILMQASNPPTLSGVLGHSSELGDAFKARFARTVLMMRVAAFASREEVDPLLDVIYDMHDRVRGKLHEDAGPEYPKGTEYWGNDPELLMWVLFTIIDSFELAYETFVGRLSADEKEDLWGDYRLLGRLFGMSDDDMPRTRADLTEYRDEMLASDRVFVCDLARERAGRFILERQVPWPRKAVWELIKSFTFASLPTKVRDGFGFPNSTLRRAAVTSAGAASRRLLPLLPYKLRKQPELSGGAPWRDISIEYRPNGSPMLGDADRSGTNGAPTSPRPPLRGVATRRPSVDSPA